jgi:hypothetical protein
MHVAASKSASYASAPSSETCNAGESISRVLRAAQSVPLTLLV